MKPALKILIVDDEFLITMDLKMQLGKIGYQFCEPAATGEKAIQVAKQALPDVVLMDLNLAGAMGGLAAAREIAAQCGTPILFMTGHVNDATMEEIRQISPLPCLLKPILVQDIHTAIMDYFNGQTHPDR
jgi:two-component system, response regulator PdtaR